ncbi:Glutamyl-tRNA(Gln) amidotransferase subunit D [uncultured archaeon]|nr:Glutamyl-tRNA(Gln) amidotransferase subunit D [uncultured archaeon]
MYSERIEKTLKAKGISVGDEVKLTSGDDMFEGVLMPRAETGDSSIIVIKLRNGYNIGLKFGDGASIKKLDVKREEFAFPKVELKKGKGLPKVSLLYTGGTIGSKVDYKTGGVHMLIKPEELLYAIPELSGIAEVEIRDLMSIASEDMTYKEWQRIAKETAEALNSGARGVVITHGTDTMHFTSAALSFMLECLNAPVVMTGAQRSSDRGSSDAFMNAICAVSLAAKSDVAEVGICMHANTSDDLCNLIRGTKARKMHTSRRDAFRPVNGRPIARIDVGGKIEYASGYKKISDTEARVKAITGFEPKVALIKVHPNSDPDVLEYYLGKGYKGAIIEGTGLGHVPIAPSDKKYSWLGAIKRAVDAGMLVGMTSQCLNGRVNTNVYTNLRLIHGAGAIYCEDMMPEVAVVKLGFLLGNYERGQAAKLLDKNLKGEITSRTEVDWR